MTHQIELRRSSKGDELQHLYRGNRTIFVDSIPWGSIHMTSHGPQGNSFTFKQLMTGATPGSGHYIYRTQKSRGVAGTRQHQVTVYGDKIASYRAGREVRVAPLEERLVDEIKTMIAEGLLRHPDVVKRENDRAHERRIAQEEAKERKASKKWNTKAKTVLRKLRNYVVVDNDADEDDVKIIVEAMKWAQTQ